MNIVRRHVAAVVALASTTLGSASGDLVMEVEVMKALASDVTGKILPEFVSFDCIIVVNKVTMSFTINEIKSKSQFIF